MGSWSENISRVKDYFRFTQQELPGLLIAGLVGGFVFSFRDWGGDQFNAFLGLTHLLMAVIIGVISLFFRVSCQKIYGLIEGYKIEFKTWWAGLGIALIVAFVTFGKVPLFLAGTVTAAFMVRHRLGEFRYGYSTWNHTMIAYWGLLSHLILALIFALLSYYFPQNYLFSKGLIFNVIASICVMIPLPQLDGLHIYFGRRFMYFLGLFLMALAAVILLTKTFWGIMFALVFGIIYGVIYLLIGSEK